MFYFNVLRARTAPVLTLPWPSSRAGEYPASPDCNVNTLQTWIKAQSAFIKKLDPHHL